MEVANPSGTSSEGENEGNNSPWVLQTFPPKYGQNPSQKPKEAEELKNTPPFVFPCTLTV